MNKEFVFSFKITNWCNLNCAHCCECSSVNETPNFMSLDKMQKYLIESKKMDVCPNELLSLSGGEAMSPYMQGIFDYIPNALNLIYSYGYIPTIKTNGTWGQNTSLRQKILYDIAIQAYKYSKLVTLDISIDEFHNNQNGVVKIFQEVLGNPDLCYAIRICLVGFNTMASRNALNSLYKKLTANGFEIKSEINTNIDWFVRAPNSRDFVYVVNDFASNIYNQGRAKDNNVYTSNADPNGNDTMNCLQIDNNDIAVLNYKYREPIQNRSLNTVLNFLLKRQTR